MSVNLINNVKACVENRTRIQRRSTNTAQLVIKNNLPWTQHGRKVSWPLSRCESQQAAHAESQSADSSMESWQVLASVGQTSAITLWIRQQQHHRML